MFDLCLENDICVAQVTFHRIASCREYRSTGRLLYLAFLVLYDRFSGCGLHTQIGLFVSYCPGIPRYDGILADQVIFPYQSKSMVYPAQSLVHLSDFILLRYQEKTEWLVVPIIVVFAFVVGLLNAVFVGVAMSTFIFVASFFRSGVVKYIANGLSVRSTIERPPNAADWLDKNGELIQILIIQNYLFFGNSSSIFTYITSMFEDPNPSIDPAFVPPIPKVIIMDLTLVTGMDTSSVDIFGDILTLCNMNKCKLFLTGLSRDLIQTMSLNGFKADTAKVRAKRKLRFFSDLDSAVGKSEDMLLQQEGFEEQINAPWHGRRGFEHA